MTEATDTLAALLVPHRDRLRVAPVEAARMFRLVTFSSAHPAITDGQTLSTQEIVDLLLHGIGAERRALRKPLSAGSDPATDSIADATAIRPADPPLIPSHNQSEPRDADHPAAHTTCAPTADR